MSMNVSREAVKKEQPNSFQWCPVTGREAMGTEKREGDFGHCLCCPEKFCMSPLRKCSRSPCTGLWATHSSGRCSCQRPPCLGGCSWWSLGSIPTQVILCFYDHQTLSYWEDDWVLAQVSQRSWATSHFEDIQKLSGNHPVQGVLSGPAWAGCLNPMISRDLFLNHSVIFWFYF